MLRIEELDVRYGDVQVLHSVSLEAREREIVTIVGANGAVKSTLINYSDTSGTVYLEKTDIPQIGYQALPLQDNYTAAALYKPTGKIICLYLKAATEGTWANGASSSEGLYLKVRPGSDGGTKKLDSQAAGVVIWCEKIDPGMKFKEGEELVEALERGDNAHSEEEIGDTLFVLLASVAAAEAEGRFSLESALQRVHEKMIRRHDHVFGETKAQTPEEAIAAWDRIKREEKARK